jgi:uncharacterized protein (TIGR02246 family)
MRVLMIGFAVVVSIGCYGQESDVRQAGAPAADVAAVQRSIDSSLARFALAMTNGDTAAMMTIYAPDAVVLPSGMPEARGRAAISQMNAGMFSMFSVAEASFRSTDLIVTGDYAIETGAYRMTMKPKTGPAMPDTGKYISVWQRQTDGSWKMIRDIFNSDLSQH